jgi:hypothetical protein
MRSKLLMTLSAIIMGIMGLLFIFVPQELLNYLNGHADFFDVLIVQVMGAMYIGFALMNWTAKANLIGGIYGRPVAIGNLCHFVIGGLALMKAYAGNQHIVIAVVAMTYGAMAIWFAVIFFTSPVRDKK